MKARIFFTFYFVMVLIGVSVCLGLEAYARESLELTDCEFHESFDYIIVTVKNVGTTSSVIIEVLLNSHPHLHNPAGLTIISPGKSEQVLIINQWSSNKQYTITLITEQGNAFHISRAAPTRQPPLKVENVTWDNVSNTVSVVFRNIGTIERKILTLALGKKPDWEMTPATLYTNIGEGISIQVFQTLTVVLNWPNDLESSWTTNQTYYFVMWPETGWCTTFVSQPSGYWNEIDLRDY